MKKETVQQREQRIQQQWGQQRTFEQSIETREGSPSFVFYEGPPTANGLPHVGHALGRTIKDMVARYKTMTGHQVLRKAGWDTHGLPVELGVEKQLGISGKSDIITSDLSRAIETAQIVSAALHLPVSMHDERIREINCGDIEGTTEAERVNKWGSNWRELDLGMEKYELVSNRGLEFLEELATTYKDKRVLVVSHGALIGLTLQRLLPDQFTKTSINNTSLTILKNMENTWSCSLYNCTKHLDE